MADMQNDLYREIRAAAVIKDGLVRVTDDGDAIRDTIEGATSLHELVRSVLASIEDDQAVVDGVSSRMADLSERKRRFEERIDAKRALVEQAMEVGEIPSIETDLATVSLRTNPPKPVVTDEAAIPSDFWEPQAPKLSLKKLAAALKEGTAIPGATLSNGSRSLTIRRR